MYHQYRCGCYYYPDTSVSANLTVINNTLALVVADHPSLTIDGLERADVQHSIHHQSSAVQRLDLFDQPDAHYLNHAVAGH